LGLAEVTNSPLVSISFSISIPLLLIAFNFSKFEKVIEKINRKPKAMTRVVSKFLAYEIFLLSVIIMLPWDFAHFVYDLTVSILLFAFERDKKNWKSRNQWNARKRWSKKRLRRFRLANFLGLWG